MVSSITGQQSPNILAGLSTPQTTPSGSMASFTDQLAAALEGYLGQSGNGSHLEIDIQTTQSQNSGVRQFIVTVKNPENAATQAAAPANLATVVTGAVFTPATPASAPVNESQASGSVGASSASPGAPLDENARTNLKRAEIDAYWATQPPAVQKLRTISDFGERSAMAGQLADQGYAVDLPIMVWGWDPMKTMLTRKMDGYNWVPSFNQSPVSTPNLALPGQTPYDPDHPPPGAIAVNTDFANGINITDPWA
jgi:hypothetical protein